MAFVFSWCYMTLYYLQPLIAMDLTYISQGDIAWREIWKSELGKKTPKSRRQACFTEFFWNCKKIQANRRSWAKRRRDTYEHIMQNVMYITWFKSLSILESEQSNKIFEKSLKICLFIQVLNQGNALACPCPLTFQVCMWANPWHKPLFWMLSICWVLFWNL